jgi:uncharacterized protein involved in exopolysaccharide biosynthesis
LANRYARDGDMTEVVARDMRVSAEDEIDLRELLLIFWRRRLLVSVIAVFFGAAAVGASFMVSKRYTAEILLAPVSGGSTSFGGGSSVLSEYKGLAALAGFASPGDEMKEESVALLKSTLITEEFIQKNHLLPILFASRWNAAEGRWRDGARVPTLWEGAQYFEKKIRSVREDTKTSLVTLSIDWKNSVEAAAWANGLVKLTNEYSREKAIRIAQRDIAFLNEQSAKTPYVEEHQAISAILESELTKEMLAEGTDEYALKVVDPAFVPEKPTFPKPLLWALLGFLGGGFVGCCYALIRYRREENRAGVSTQWTEPADATKRDAGYSVTDRAGG